METFTGAKALVDHPDFLRERERQVRHLEEAIRNDEIDRPLVPLMHAFSAIPSCYTQQCCCGHFIHEYAPDKKNLVPVSRFRGAVEQVEYRIAYLALCIEKSERGQALLRDFHDLPAIDPAYVQFGSADWFWNQAVNSYAVQVVPDRWKCHDTATVDFEEAVHIESVRDRFFIELSRIAQNHLKP